MKKNNKLKVRENIYQKSSPVGLETRWAPPSPPCPPSTSRRPWPASPPPCGGFPPPALHRSQSPFCSPICRSNYNTCLSVFVVPFSFNIFNLKCCLIVLGNCFSFISQTFFLSFYLWVFLSTSLLFVCLFLCLFPNLPCSYF